MKWFYLHLAPKLSRKTKQNKTNICGQRPHQFAHLRMVTRSVRSVRPRTSQQIKRNNKKKNRQVILLHSHPSFLFFFLSCCIIIIIIFFFFGWLARYYTIDAKEIDKTFRLAFRSSPPLTAGPILHGCNNKKKEKEDGPRFFPVMRRLQTQSTCAALLSCV